MKTNVQLSPLVHAATATEVMEFVPTQVIAVVNGVGAEPRQIIVSRHQLQRQVTLTQAHLRLLPTVLMLDSVLLVRWEMASVLANLSVAQTGGTAEKANSTASRQRFGTKILLVKTRTMMERVVAVVWATANAETGYAAQSMDFAARVSYTALDSLGLLQLTLKLKWPTTPSRTSQLISQMILRPSLALGAGSAKLMLAATASLSVPTTFSAQTVKSAGVFSSTTVTLLRRALIQSVLILIWQIMTHAVDMTRPRLVATADPNAKLTTSALQESSAFLPC